MSGYLPTLEYRTTFEDDAVTVRMTPMNRKSYIKVAPKLSGVSEGDPELQAEIYGLALDCLAEHIQDISGLKDADGNAISKDAVLDAVYFVSLVNEMFEYLVISASLGKDQGATSEDKSPVSTTAHALPQVPSVGST